MLVIIVGGIPIAMPTVLSVTLALGAAKLAKEGAIVARQSAVEEMAGMDVLCSDKTGARLTMNSVGCKGCRYAGIRRIIYSWVRWLYSFSGSKISVKLRRVRVVQKQRHVQQGRATTRIHWALKARVPYSNLGPA